MLPESDRPDQEEQIRTDETNSWFWRPHTITALSIFLVSLAYFALFETGTSYGSTTFDRTVTFDRPRKLGIQSSF